MDPRTDSTTVRDLQKLKRIALAILCLSCLVPSTRSQIPLPPMEGSIRHGCSAEQYYGSSDDNLWHVHIWVDYADGHKQNEKATHGWIRLLAIRDNRERALKDCDDFMKEVDKLYKKEKKK